MPEWTEVIIRSVSILVALFFILKVLGRKQLSELSFFETIIGLTIADFAGTLSVDVNIPYTHGLAAILCWTMFPFLIDRFVGKNKKLRDFVEGKSSVFIRDGKILEGNLKKEKITADELMEMLRPKGVFRASEVEFATYEPTGQLSVLLKKKYQPVTVGDLVQNPKEEKEPQVVIMDGSVLDDSLSALQLRREWLDSELEKIGVEPKQIFLGEVDTYGKLHIDLYDDKREVSEPVATELLFASMTKCKVDLELFSLQTKNQNAKVLYKQYADNIDQLILEVTNNQKK
ncbi:DUF421 domain-containing protein [Bacillus sp. DJP31]|uniref:DUF421 domain-containing protein n=1 Tax=Bacillus sp. DJP31 TaxID=3409789 RepID=UPI003BB57537